MLLPVRYFCYFVFFVVVVSRGGSSIKINKEFKPLEKIRTLRSISPDEKCSTIRIENSKRNVIIYFARNEWGRNFVTRVDERVKSISTRYI